MFQLESWLENPLRLRATAFCVTKTVAVQIVTNPAEEDHVIIFKGVVFIFSVSHLLCFHITEALPRNL
jgi:hypothetical protein